MKRCLIQVPLALASILCAECLAGESRGKPSLSQPNWMQLAGPLLLACQTLLYVWMGKSKEAGGGAGASRAKKTGRNGAVKTAPVKDAFASVALLAASCIRQLVSMAGRKQAMTLLHEATNLLAARSMGSGWLVSRQRCGWIKQQGVLGLMTWMCKQRIGSKQLFVG